MSITERIRQLRTLKVEEAKERAERARVTEVKSRKKRIEQEQMEREQLHRVTETVGAKSILTRINNEILHGRGTVRSKTLQAEYHWGKRDLWDGASSTAGSEKKLTEITELRWARNDRSGLDSMLSVNVCTHGVTVTTSLPTRSERTRIDDEETSFMGRPGRNRPFTDEELGKLSKDTIEEIANKFVDLTS